MINMNETAKNFLESYARGSETEGGWLFAKALQQAQLDYSETSLNRLDGLLTTIRERGNPTSEMLRETQQGRNFCSLIAFYLVETVRRRIHANMEWHDRASALATLPPGARLPDAPFARLVLLTPDQGAAFMPLGWIEDQMLGPQPRTKAVDYVTGLMQQIERDGPAVWWTGMRAVGQMASWQMMMAADGGAVVPMMLRANEPTTWVTLMSDNIDEALGRGARSLDENPDNNAWQILAYDGVADLKRGRTDAVMVLLNTYGTSPTHGELPLKLKVAFPYRPATKGGLFSKSRPFAILDPTLLMSNIEYDKLSMLNGAMEHGIQSIKWAFGTTWNQLRESAS